MWLLEPHLILGLVPIILTIVILVAILTLVTKVTKVKIGGSLGCPSMEVRFLKPTC